MAQALGAAGVLTLVAMAVGPLVGESLATRAGWPWVFRGAAIAASAGLALALWLPRLRGGEPPPPSSSSWSERFPPALLRPLGAMLLVATGFGAVVSFLADHAHLVGDFGVTRFFHAYVAAAVLMRLLAGDLSDRIGRHPVIVPSFLGQALALLGLAMLSAPWQLWPLGAIYGVSHGIYYPALAALIVERSSSARRARAVASGNLAFAIGMAVAAFAGGALARQAGYVAVYAATAAASLVAMLVLGIDAAHVSSLPQGGPR
jgi:predicted MFS family arabinose efflux permease